MTILCAFLSFVPSVVLPFAVCHSEPRLVPSSNFSHRLPFTCAILAIQRHSGSRLASDRCVRAVLRSSEALVEYDYEAQHTDELTIRVGDVVTDLAPTEPGLDAGTAAREGRRLPRQLRQGGSAISDGCGKVRGGPMILLSGEGRSKHLQTQPQNKNPAADFVHYFLSARIHNFLIKCLNFDLGGGGATWPGWRLAPWNRL